MSIARALRLGVLVAVAPAVAAPAAAQAVPPATVVDAATIEGTIRRSIAENRLDTKMTELPVKGGVLRIGVVHRPSPEPRALLHQDLTEIYSIVEGTGTLITGGTYDSPRAVADPPNIGTTPTFYVTQSGGTTRTVKPKDVIVIPAGTPHRFTAIDGAITYVIYRFEPAASR